jgi:uncharacterized protein (TIGR02246 family)
MHDDEAAIQRLLNTYSQTASSGEWEAAAGTYAEDGVWDIPHLGIRVEGRAEVRRQITEFFDTMMDYVLQINSPALIEVSGDRATARSGIRECGKAKGRMEGFEFLGLYEDELVRTPEGWRFAKRTFRGLGTHYFPLTSGEAHRAG